MSRPAEPPAWRTVLVADGVAMVVVVLALVLLHGGLLEGPGSRVTLTQFAATHGWAFDRMARMLAGTEPWTPYTNEVSFPARLYAAHIAWVPGVIAAPFNWLGGPVLGLSAATVLAPSLGVPAVSALARRLCGANAAVAAAAGAVFSLSPPALGGLANGQLCKAQLWALALGPLAVMLAARSWRWLVAVPLLGAAVVFTEPTYALIGALVVPLAVVAGARGAGGWLAWARAVAAAGALAAVFLVARGYYAGDGAGLYVPAAAVRISWFDHYVLQVATPWSLLAGRDYAVRPDLAVHVDYLGPVALVAVAWALVKRGSGRWFSGALVLVGVVLALGERLVTLEGPVRRATQAIGVPALFLAKVHFPLAHSGQYYRFLGLAWLGVVLGAASLSPRVSVAVLGVLLVDGLRATASLWPIPSAPFDGLACFTAPPAGVEGWRLDLPRKRDLGATGRRDLATAVDGIPTTDPPAAWAMEHPANRLVPALGHMGAAAIRERLDQEGVVRVVAWTPGLQGDAATIATELGPPTCTDGEVRVWDRFER